MKHISTLIITFVCLFAAFSPVQASPAEDTPQQRYIDKYADLAVEEMRRSGVPASITLAQGLLESRYGQSDLAVKGNNHFGIKCHSNWNGAKMRVDDDKEKECFRKYRTVEQSYRDHSDFLRYRDRYKFLFDLDPKDYKGWAYGLKKAGYATDPAYPKKLINLIEEYELYKYDRGRKYKNSKVAKEPAPEVEATKPAKEEVKEPEVAAKEVKPAKAKKEKKQRVKKDKTSRTVDVKSPSQLEQPKPVKDEKAKNTFTIALSRQKYSLNGVPFIYASKGDTYASIAASNNLFQKEILRYNDLDAAEELLPGTIVYLQPKKKQTVKGLDKHIVESEGETLRGIAQRYAITLKSLCKMNNLPQNHTLRPGEELLLRK
ncbi:MAG: glucosaminidase domain-containing protein [Bacteroidales bacterium]|nr:glucosaminidase domain-containing protein [Bacteroidales bacterium]